MNTQMADGNKVTDRNFYIVMSSRGIPSIESIIRSAYEKVEESNLKPFCHISPYGNRNYNPITEKRVQNFMTLVVCDSKVYDHLKEDEHNIDEFKINKLIIKSGLHPNVTRSESSNLYIRCPLNLTLSSCQNHLMQRMSFLRTYGLWDKNEYRIIFPKMDRFKDKHNGHAKLFFNCENKIEDIILTKLFIYGTKWPDTNLNVNCSWHKIKHVTNDTSNG